MATPFVSVIVVNYDGLHFLRDCFHALERQTYPRHRFEVLMIDNGSADNSNGYVRQEFPWVTVLEQRENLGFAEGNNVGIRLARGEWVSLLNNDTVVDPDWLKELVASANAPTIGGVTSRILFRDRPNVINSTGLVLYRDGRGGDRNLNCIDDYETQRPAEVFGGCGASLLLRRAMLDDIGLFDSRLFMYYEDLDLAWRARIEGWKFVYAPRSKVFHVHCGTTVDQSPFLVTQVERNRFLVNLKNAPIWLLLFSAVGLPTRLVREVYRWLGRSRARPAHLRSVLGAFASAVVQIPLFLWKRYQIRGADGRQPDIAIRRWILKSPAMNGG